jgi:hypothetical protein
MSAGSQESPSHRLLVESEALEKFYKEELLHGFPYDDLRAVKDWGGPKYSEIIPTLELYRSKIAGYASSGKTILRWSVDRRAAARADCCLSFFEERPEYAELHVALDLFPVLRHEFEVYEFARKQVLGIVERIEEASSDGTPA